MKKSTCYPPCSLNRSGKLSAIFFFCLFPALAPIGCGAKGESGFDPLAFLSLAGERSRPWDTQADWYLVLGEGASLDGDNVVDCVPFDSSGDGAIDSCDTDGDGFGDILLLDTDGDGHHDAIDTNGDGAGDYFACTANGRTGLSRLPECGGERATIVDSDSDGWLDGFDFTADNQVDDMILLDIRADVTPPSIVFSSANPPGTYGAPQTTIFNCADNVSPGSIVAAVGTLPAYNPIQGRFFLGGRGTMKVGEAVDGSYTLKVRCRDMAGNLSGVWAVTYMVSTVLPSVTITPPTVPYVSAAVGAINSIYLNTTLDSAGRYVLRAGGTDCSSGVQVASGRHQYPGMASMIEVNATQHFSASGPVLFRVYAYVDVNDNGQCDPGVDVIGGSNIVLTRDDTPPVVTASPGGGSSGSTAATISLICQDNESGCRQIVYYDHYQAGYALFINGSHGATNGRSYSSPFSLTRVGTTHLTYTARDYAGNVAVVTEELYGYLPHPINIQTIQASTWVGPSAPAPLYRWRVSGAIGDYSIRLGGTDCSSGSGTELASGSVAFDDIEYTGLNTAPLVEGQNTLRFCFIESAIIQASTSMQVLRDFTPPAVTFTGPLGPGPHPDGSLLTFSCSDAGAGCRYVVYTLNGGDPSVSLDPPAITGDLYGGPIALPVGTTTVKALAFDRLGNISGVITQTFTVVP